MSYRIKSPATAALEKAKAEPQDPPQDPPEVTMESPDADALVDAFTKEELVAEAERRELEVTRADGEDEDPLKADYARVIAESNAAE